MLAHYEDRAHRGMYESRLYADDADPPQTLVINSDAVLLREANSKKLLHPLRQRGRTHRGSSLLGNPPKQKNHLNRSGLNYCFGGA